MPIHHLALPDDWAAAQRSGDYRVSTRGVTLADEGFIHCSDPDQVEDVRSRFYADVTDLLLLTIDTDRLTSPWRYDDVPGSPRPFPHVYGPIDLAAVVEVRRL